MFPMVYKQMNLQLSFDRLMLIPSFICIIYFFFSQDLCFLFIQSLLLCIGRNWQITLLMSMYNMRCLMGCSLSMIQQEVNYIYIRWLDNSFSLLPAPSVHSHTYMCTFRIIWKTWEKVIVWKTVIWGLDECKTGNVVLFSLSYYGRA